MQKKLSLKNIEMKPYCGSELFKVQCVSKEKTNGSVASVLNLHKIVRFDQNQSLCSSTIVFQNRSLYKLFILNYVLV